MNKWRQYLIEQRESRRLLGSARVGKVRIAAVKKVARELVERYPDKFSTNYESNKKVIGDLVDAKTKRLRNRVVGYVTRLKIVEVRRAEAPTEAVQESDQE